MKTLTEDEKGVNILSLGRSCHQIFLKLNSDSIVVDAGSPGGVLSQMYILAELMVRLRSELGLDGDLLPSDYFDLIGGSGIGA